MCAGYFGLGTPLGHRHLGLCLLPPPLGGLCSLCFGVPHLGLGLLPRPLGGFRSLAPRLGGLLARPGRIRLCGLQRLLARPPAAAAPPSTAHGSVPARERLRPAVSGAGAGRGRRTRVKRAGGGRGTRAISVSAKTHPIIAASVPPLLSPPHGARGTGTHPRNPSCALRRGSPLGRGNKPSARKAAAGTRQSGYARRVRVHPADRRQRRTCST